MLALFDVAFVAACAGLVLTLQRSLHPGLVDHWGVAAYFFVCAIGCSMIRSSYEEYINGEIHRCN